MAALPSIREARLAIAALVAAAPGMPATVSFICTSAHATSGGDDFGEAVCDTIAASSQLAGQSGGAGPVVGVGLNCTSPRYVSELLQRARRASYGAPPLEEGSSGAPSQVANSLLPHGVLLLASPSTGATFDGREGARSWSADEEVSRPVTSACDLFPRPALTCVSICSCVAQVLLDHSHAMAMVDAGANFVGGCCRVTASQIRTFRKALAAAPQGQLA